MFCWRYGDCSLGGRTLQTDWLLFRAIIQDLFSYSQIIGKYLYRMLGDCYNGETTKVDSWTAGETLSRIYDNPVKFHFFVALFMCYANWKRIRMRVCSKWWYGTSCVTTGDPILASLWTHFYGEQTFAVICCFVTQTMLGFKTFSKLLILFSWMPLLE